MAALIAVLFTAGCATVPEPPVSDAQIAQIRTVMLDQQWRSVSIYYPELERPVVRVERTVSPYQWTRVLGDCLHDAGYNVEVSTDGMSFSADSGESVQDYSLATYVCTARFPDFGTVISQLDAPAFIALQAFWAGTVAPCLTLAGEPAPRAAARVAPEGSPEITAQSVIGMGAYPIAGLVQGREEADVARLEQRCPTVPAWLDLARGQ